MIREILLALQTTPEIMLETLRAWEPIFSGLLLSLRALPLWLQAQVQSATTGVQ